MEDNEESIGDQNGDLNVSADQQSESADGNDNQQPTTATELDINGVKVSLDSLKSNPALKDVFDAHENRQKWQAKLTQESQKIKQLERDAREYQRLRSDPRFQQLSNPQQPANRYEAMKQGFVQKMSQKYGDRIDPEFLNGMADFMAEVSGHRAQEAIAPFQTQYLTSWERQFIKDHPLVEQDTPEYDALSDLIGKGADPEMAYKAVYADKIVNAEIEARIKKQNDANALKLKRSRQPGGTNQKSAKPKSFDEAFEEAYQEHGGNQW